MYPLETLFLIVDDYKTMRSTIKNALKELGYTNFVALSID